MKCNQIKYQQHNSNPSFKLVNHIFVNKIYPQTKITYY